VVADAAPTPTPPPQRQPARPPGGTAHAGMSTVVHRNIQSLLDVKHRDEERRGPSERVADGVTAFAGSMWCVYAHAAVFGAWIIANRGWVPGVKPFDPFPFVMLAMFASVEAIFLSTFILISQNRAQKLADRRAELDLHISLLTEHELTRAIQMIDDVARRLGATRPPEHELEEIKKDVVPEKVAEEIERAQG
jgi:uncharacterized membrane protein